MYTLSPATDCNKLEEKSETCSMKFRPPPKRKKVDAAASDSSVHSTPAVPSLEKKDVVTMLIDKSTGHESHDTHMSRVNSRIQQARDFAVAEARQDGCLTSFRIFDSPYGNYLVPVIPTRAELGG